jgi:hypothetical protein
MYFLKILELAQTFGLLFKDKKIKTSYLSKMGLGDFYKLICSPCQGPTTNEPGTAEKKELVDRSRQSRVTR